MNKNSKLYRVVPCTNGVCAFLTKTDLDSLTDAGIATTTEHTVLLPGGMDNDTLAPIESYLYSSSISLTDDDLNFLSSSEESFSFTCYGPESLDKAVNEDFALSGQFLDDKNRICARFSIIADGISNGFAVPQRGAQISCFATYQCLKRNWHDLWAYRSDSLGNEDVQDFRDQLTDNIRRLLNDDYRHLVDQMVEPPHISEKVWRERFLHHPERWYGNTLIISFLSVCGGFVLFIGDGAVVLIKGDVKKAQDVIRSDDDSQISAYVTTDLTSGMISGAAITTKSDTDYVEIITATDGLDRTFSRAGRRLTDLFCAQNSTGLVIEEILGLDNRYPKHFDADNYSIARVFFESKPSRHERLAGRHAGRQAFAPSAMRQNSIPDCSESLRTAGEDKKERPEHVGDDTNSEKGIAIADQSDAKEQAVQKRSSMRYGVPMLFGLLLCTAVVLAVWTVHAWLDSTRSVGNKPGIQIEQTADDHDVAQPLEPRMGDELQESSVAAPKLPNWAAENAQSAVKESSDAGDRLPSEPTEDNEAETSGDMISPLFSQPATVDVLRILPTEDDEQQQVDDRDSVPQILPRDPRS